MGPYFRTEAKMWFQLNHDLWFNFEVTLMPFRASANARSPEHHHLKGHWTCLECLRGLMAVNGDGWIMMDGWTDGRRTDGLFVCPSP